MTLEEIYSELNAHMIKGLMIHDQMSNYYCFLNLKGYAECHKYHYLSESQNYMEVNRYYLRHHNKLIKSKQIDDPKVIPNSWYAYERKDVDATTKRNAVKTGLEKWIDWEKDTKTLYQKMYVELMNMGEVADAQFLECFICDVDEELAGVESLYVKRKTTDFDISSIMSDQDKKYKEYCKKIKECY